MAEWTGRASGQWRVALLGRLQATTADRIITRFPGRPAALLVAYLAYHRHRSHAREALVELLWPETPPRVGRNRLNQTLTALRHQLEPPGVLPGAVIRSEREWVGLNPDAVRTDVAEFHESLRLAATTSDVEARVRYLAAAVEGYRGELIAGHHAEWILVERETLTAAFSAAVRELLRLLESLGEQVRALECARRGAQIDPWCEEVQHELIRLLAASGQQAAAVRHYREWERRLREELGAAPPSETAHLIEAIRRTTGESPACSSRSFHAESEPVHPGEGELHPSSDAGAGPPTILSELASDRSAIESHLPLRLTRFFGREAELRELEAQLRPAAAGQRTDRLLTLTGPGGSGKTRLSIEAAERIQQVWDGAVWFVPLLDLADPRLIYDRTLSVLEWPGDPKGDPLDRLVAFLKQQPSLLVMDNFEHLVDGGTDELLRLLERVPSLRVTVTSRQRLGVPGERELAVRPLPVPPVPEDGLALSSAGGAEPAGEGHGAVGDGGLLALACNPSVALFLNRAQAVRAEFQLTARNAGVVAELCRQLEGLPLAIELAAARVSVLTPRQLLERLSERFRLLQSRSPDADPRHRSLRATLDWSYQLLPPELRRFFVQLSVFRGGWTAEAASAVCEAPEALEFLQQLRESSFVQAEETDAQEIRFSLLETLREFGDERLESDERSALRRRHAGYYREVARAAQRTFERGSQVSALHWMRQEHENFRTVLVWGLSKEGDPELTLETGSLLFHHWGATGRADEALTYLEPALERTGLVGNPRIRCAALTCAGQHASALEQFPRARAYLEQALALAQDEEDRSEDAWIRLNLAIIAIAVSDFGTARTLAAATHATFEEIGSAAGVGQTRLHLGRLAALQGDIRAAERWFEAALAYARQTSDGPAISECLIFLGGVVLARGDTWRARSIYEEALEIARRLGSKFEIADRLGNLAGVDEYEGEYNRAAGRYVESLALSRECGRPARLWWALLDLSGIERRRGNLDAADNYLREVRPLMERLGTRSFVGILRMYEAEVATARGDEVTARRQYGESLEIAHEIGDPQRVLRCLEGLARLASASGQEQQAAHLLGAAAALRQSVAQPLPRCDQPEMEALVERLRRTLGVEAFQAAWREGETMAPEEAAAMVLGRFPPRPQPDPGITISGVPPKQPPAHDSTGDDLTDREWTRLEPLLPSSMGRRGRPFSDHRRVIDGIRWKLRTDAPWRDIPRRYAPWRTCHERYQSWQTQGLWQCIEYALSELPPP